MVWQAEPRSFVGRGFFILACAAFEAMMFGDATCLRGRRFERQPVNISPGASSALPRSKEHVPLTVSIAIVDYYNGRRPHSSLDGITPDHAYFTPLPLRLAA